MNIENTIEESIASTKFNGFGDDLYKIIPDIDKATDVPVVEASELNNKKFYKDWVSKNKPCLIKNAIKHWPAIEKFKNQDYWLSELDNFDVSIYPHMNYFTEERKHMGRIRTTFHDAVKRFFKNEDFILSLPSTEISENNEFSKLIKEMPGFSFVSKDIKPIYYEHRRFFMYRRAATAWHYHGMDETLMCQINGTKKVVLFPPKISGIKHISNFLENEFFLEGEVLDDNTTVNPIVAYAEEGDTLYIPPFWNHAVIPVDGELGFTVAHCWKSPHHKYGDFSNYYVRRMYKTNMWPINRYTFTMMFTGVYSGILNLLNKLKG
jgi:hypothetical protein